MMRPVSLSHVVRWLKRRKKKSGLLTRRSSKRASLYLAVSLFLGCILFGACSSPFGGGSSTTPKPTSSTQALNKINWCQKPLMVFRDEGAFTPTPQATATANTTPTPKASATVQATGTATPTGTPSATSKPAISSGTPQTITDWSVVKANLGFTVYLPTTLPNGSCLVSAQATIHDPIFGGSFTIAYLLPDGTSLSVSEAPLKSQNTTFQCNGTGTPTTTTSGKAGTPTAATPSPTAVPTQLCSGAKNTTNIVISGPGSVDQLQQIFNNLQPDVDWIPA
jgi:hypothetical protein